MQPGYYMIGRHKECQIRPKSRSVSRRHCVLFRQEDALSVLDLASTSGTRVNEEKLPPRAWITLSDGDLLRCGKIVFRVDFETLPDAPTAGKSDSDAKSMVNGAAWQEVDIADYLDSEDDADRVRRYESIRGGGKAAADDPDAQISDEFDPLDDSDEGRSPAVDGATNPGGATLDDDESLPTQIDGDPEPVLTASSSPATEKEAKPAPRRPKPIRMPKAKRQRLSGSGRSWMPRLGDAEQLKMIGAVVLTIAAISGVAYSGYRYYNGPTVRVLDGID